MEQYLDAKIKRFTQKQLFKKITKVKTMLGLGGLHPEKYLEVVPEHKNCVLVDFNPADALVRRNSLIGEFDLLYIYTKMQLSPIRNKYITFTFSCRTAGDERTIEWLAKNFPELDIPRNYVFINDTRCKEIGYRQYVKRMYDPTRDRFLDIYKYRDSGDNMITGLIKIL